MAGDRTAAALGRIFDSYVRNCRPGGAGAVRVGQQVRAAARGALDGGGPEGRFTLLPFYPSLTQSLQRGDPCQSSLSGLLRAAQLLETLCVNLFLFPWRKEFRTLKKFTGSFIYYIKPGFPDQTTKTILQTIGYCLETDSEYILVGDADPDMAKRMGFELFLARLECEYLLEAMGQKSQAECLEIVHGRAASLNSLGSPGKIIEEELQSVREETLEDDEELNAGPGSNPASNNDQKCILSPNPANLDVQENPVSEERSSKSFLTDHSILEMKVNYPDLAIHQQFIFQKPQKTAPKIKDWIVSKEPSADPLDQVNTDLSGPQSITLHTESTTTHRNLHTAQQLEPAELRPSEEKPPLVLRVGRLVQNPTAGPDASADDGLATELAESKLQVKEFSPEESLKYPIEETAQDQPCQGPRDFMPVSPCPPEEKNPPVLCRPSQQPVCTVGSCGICAGPTDSDVIKEPPHSFYIPNSLSGCSPAPAPPKGHRQNCGEGSSLQLHRSPAQQPEDDFVQTFVIL